MCGEEDRPGLSPPLSLGSPPRVRGGDSGRVLALLSDRITPACAGRRDKTNIYQIVLKDHPRVCGEELPE